MIVFFFYMFHLIRRYVKTNCHLVFACNFHLIWLINCPLLYYHRATTLHLHTEWHALQPSQCVTHKIKINSSRIGGINWVTFHFYSLALLAVALQVLYSSSSQHV